MKALTLALAVFVALAAPAAAAPTPKFTYKPARPEVGQLVVFKPTGTRCGHPPCAYTWRSIHTLLHHGKVLRTSFARPGIKKIRLTVRNSDGEKRTRLRRLRVRGPVATVPQTPSDGEGGPPAAQCTKHAAAGSSFSSAVSGAGAHLCLDAGTYTWGDYRVPGGTSIEASSGVAATVVGEARISEAGAALDNLTLRAAPGENHAVVSVDAADFTARRLEVDAQNIEHVQGFLVGGDRAKILDTKIHSVRGPGGCSGGGGDGLNGTHFHGIYWYDSTGGEVRRIWMYDISGFGLHFYSGTGSNTQVSQTVTDDTLCNFGNVFDSQQGPVSFDKTILTDAGGWRCLSSGATVTNSRSQSGFGSCSGSGNVTGDTAYQNEAARDYRVPGDPAMQFVPGPR